MSYAKLEAKIRAEAFQDLSNRANLLDGQLAELTAATRWPGPELERELQYLERMVAAAPARDRHSAVAEQVAALRQCFDGLLRGKVPPQPAATAADGAAAVQLFGAPPAADPPSLLQPQTPVGACGGQGGQVTPLASFLLPEQAAEQGQDEVRLLAAEGRLVEELHRYPILSVPGTNSALVLRSWTAEDDELGQQRERVVLLELAQAAANIVEMERVLNEHVGQDQEHLDQIELHIAQARQDVREAVVTLASAQTDTERLLAWLAPSVGLVILGGGIAAIAPAAVAGCGVCIAVRGGFVAGALGFHVIGTKKLSQWQTRALQSLTEKLPSAFNPLPEEEARLLSRAGDEVQRRLLTKLGDRKSWSRFYGSPVALVMGLKPWCRTSDIRGGGHAFSTSFTVDRLRAREAFRAVRQLSITGSLDPTCKVAWSRPVTDGAEGTYVRYLIFTNPVSTRDFYCVSRCGQVRLPEDSGAETGEAGPGVSVGIERFIFAVSSLTPEILASAGLPESNQGLEHGCIHISGISVADTGKGGSFVEVMADVDAAPSWPVPAYLADREVRLHVLRTAFQVANELKQMRGAVEA